MEHKIISTYINSSGEIDWSLSPTINIYDISNMTQIITAWIMAYNTTIKAYIYILTNYDNNKEYRFIIDFWVDIDNRYITWNIIDTAAEVRVGLTPELNLINTNLDKKISDIRIKSWIIKQESVQQDLVTWIETKLNKHLENVDKNISKINDTYKSDIDLLRTDILSMKDSIQVPQINIDTSSIENSISILLNNDIWFKKSVDKLLTIQDVLKEFKWLIEWSWNSKEIMDSYDKISEQIKQINISNWDYIEKSSNSISDNTINAINGSLQEYKSYLNNILKLFDKMKIEDSVLNDIKELLKNDSWFEKNLELAWRKLDTILYYINK